MAAVEQNLARSLSSATLWLDGTHLAKLVTANLHEGPPNTSPGTICVYELAVVGRHLGGAFSN